MTKWQYLSVLNDYRYVEKGDRWSLITTTTVSCGGEAVARFSSETPVTGSPDEVAKITPIGEQHPEYQPEDLRRLWDHLGSLGWELVTGYVRANALRTGDQPGWVGTWSSVLGEAFIFKRPVV